MKPFLRFISLLFLLIVTSNAQLADDGSECAIVLKKIDQELQDFAINLDPKSLSNVTKGFAVFSGRFLNDFGEYDLCQNFTTNYYLTMLFTGNISNATFDGMVGFCAPTNCSIPECEANTDLIFKIYLHGMTLPLANITVKNSTTFYDPKGEPPGDVATTYAIFFILSGLVLLVGAGTVMGGYWEAKKESQQKEQNERLLTRDQASDENNGDINRESHYIPAPNPVPRKRNEIAGIYKFLDCFDARKNFEKIVKVKYTDTYDFNLEVFNGIRVFMMLYVVYGHTFLFGTNYIDNLTDLADLGNDWRLLVPNAALYAVDVFFYMGGFLFAYIGLGKLKKIKPNLVNFLGLLLHRFLRIWPTYVVALIFFWRVLPYLGEGPVWFKITSATQLCEGTIWQNLLFLDDMLVKSADYCFGWGWYLSNDFQMFLVAPLLLWLYIKNRRHGKIAMIALMCFSYILAFVIGAELHVRGTPPKAGGITNGEGFSRYYVKPYIRIPPFLIGILVALIYKEYKEQIGSSYKVMNAIKQSKLAKNLIFIIGVLLLLVLTFAPRQVQLDDAAWPDWFHVTWRAFQKSLYVVATTMVILPSLLGDNTYFKRFLCHPLLVPLARLSFTAYLVHLFWIYHSYFSATSSFHFTFGNVTYNTLANGAVAFIMGLVLSLVIEVPMANIESVYLNGGGKRSNKAKQAEKDASLFTGASSSVMPISSKVNERV